jgi:hypothetical protein
MEVSMIKINGMSFTLDEILHMPLTKMKLQLKSKNDSGYCPQAMFLPSKNREEVILRVDKDDFTIEKSDIISIEAEC